MIAPYRRLGLSCCVAERRNPLRHGADTPVGSAEPGLDEGFAFVAELEGEEVAALVEGAKEDFVPFTQFLRRTRAFEKLLLLGLEPVPRRDDLRERRVTVENAYAAQTTTAAIALIAFMVSYLYCLSIVRT